MNKYTKQEVVDIIRNNFKIEDVLWNNSHDNIIEFYTKDEKAIRVVFNEKSSFLSHKVNCIYLSNNKYDMKSFKNLGNIKQIIWNNELKEIINGI